jgi:AraC-like DNA-binding protein
VIDDLPKTTPPEDSIFICGTFNGWATDSHYMLHKRLDGKYSITLNIDSAFEYKFHRGNWAKVETSSRNQYMVNRHHEPGGARIVYVSIENWQDLGGAKPFEIVSFYFFAMAFLAIAAAYFLFRIRNKKKSRTRSVIILLLFLAAMLFGRVIIEVVSLPRQFQLGLLGDIWLLIAGPLWYKVLKASMKKELIAKGHWVLPGLVAVLFMMRFFNIELLSFLTSPVNKNFVTWDDLMSFILSSASLSFYTIASLLLWKKVRPKKEFQPEEISFMKTLIIAGAIFLVLLLMKLPVLSGEKESSLLWYNRNLLPAAGSLFVWIICYFAFTYDEIFRVTQQVLRKTDDLEQLKTMLHQAMIEQRAYTNPHLTLNDLSEIVNIKPHILSRIINEYYHQNFRDFVNKYRIEEFISLANQGASKRFTFLALAYEVGFNSKSTFNVAFKKMMNVTPREYFQHRKDNLFKDNDLKSATL